MSSHFCPSAECAANGHRTGNTAGIPTVEVDKDAEIARLKRELAEVKALSVKPAAEENTDAWYWVSTMRGEQPRCRNCDGQLTRGPKGGVTDSFCPQCGAELRTNVPSLERR